MSWGQEPPYFAPLPGFEHVDGSDMDVDEEDSEPGKPADILKNIRTQLDMAVKTSAFEVADVVSSGPILADDTDAPKAVVVRDEGVHMSGQPFAPSPIGQLAISKLDELMVRQDATQALVKKLENKLTRLDSLAEAVAGINLTLRRAAEGNRRAAPYTPPRPHMHLPGQRSRRPQAHDDSDFTA